MENPPGKRPVGRPKGSKNKPTAGTRGRSVGRPWKDAGFLEKTTSKKGEQRIFIFVLPIDAEKMPQQEDNVHQLEPVSRVDASPSHPIANESKLLLLFCPIITVAYTLW